ncbi:MAG: hypothetical protein H6742_20005 [Alphaproteobacteria bacterium]|nr:hypothetical protein [Alphaproteobacteria bacterium]
MILLLLPLLSLACGDPPAFRETTTGRDPPAAPPSSSPALRPSPRERAPDARSEPSLQCEIEAVALDGEGQEEAVKVIRRYRGSVQACAEREATRGDLDLPVDLQLRLEITAGKVTGTNTGGVEDELRACIVRASRSWRFDAGVTGALTADYSLTERQ